MMYLEMIMWEFEKEKYSVLMMLVIVMGSHLDYKLMDKDSDWN